MTGLNGERQLQLQYGTQNRAQGFYDNQMLEKLNPAMVDFIAKQQMASLKIPISAYCSLTFLITVSDCMSMER